jgi:HK97 family phage portal protein
VRNPFKRREEQRAITSLPWDVGGSGTSTAVNVDRALSLAPVFAATSLIAASVSTLPVCAYRMVSGSPRPQSTLPELFAVMRNTGTLIPWLFRAVTSLLLRGNAVGLITSRDDLGYPVAIEWLNPDDVSVLDSMPSGPGSFRSPVWYWMGRVVSADDIVHIAWYTLPGRVMGLSPIGAFASTVNAGLFVQDYGNTWFETGGFPPGTFKNTEQEVDQKTATAMGARLDHAMRRRRPLVYGKDWEYKPISVPPNEAQFVEAAHLSANQIAAIYHLPAEKVGGQPPGGLHYTTAEMDQIDVAMFGVRPWVEVLEGAFYALLPGEVYVKLDLAALVRADLKTEHEVYQIDLAAGIRTVNEIRARMDLAPLPPQPKPAPPPPATPAGPAAGPMPAMGAAPRLLLPPLNGTSLAPTRGHRVPGGLE